MYENKFQPLAPKRVYYRRLRRNIFLASFILAICLAIGVFGYHYIAGINWIDSVHNASMILSGMGPVADVKPFWGKIFSSAYALFSGVAFITNIGFLLAPSVHRFLHKLHVQDDDSKEDDDDDNKDIKSRKSLKSADRK
jgi:hypothetical protein